MMNNPKVSIIVPVYNVEKYLKCCVDSLLNQTLTEIEVILVDDASPDHCPAICDEYAKHDHRVRVVHKKNEGLGYARNSGLEVATGEYIAFVDSDDFVELDTYQKLYSKIINTQADAVYFFCKCFNEQGKTWLNTHNNEEMRYPSKKEIQGAMLDMISNPPMSNKDTSIISCSACNALYRRDLIEKYGIKFKSERELISEDLLFNLNFLLHCTNIISIPDTFYNYRENLSSLTHTIKPDSIAKNLFFYQYLMEMLNVNDFGIEGYYRATRRFISITRTAIKNYIQSSFSKKEKLQWLKEVVKHPIWREIASLYPYKKLPLKHSFQFYLLHKGDYRLLYYYSKLFIFVKLSAIHFKNIF